MTREALERVPADDLVRAAAEFGAAGRPTSDSGLLLMPVVDGGLLPVGPRGGGGVRLGVRGAAADRHHPGRVGVLHRRRTRPCSSLDDDGLRRWMRRLTPDAEVAGPVIASVRRGPARPGRAGAPRGTCGWPSPPSTCSGCRPSAWPTPTPPAPSPGSAPTATCSPGSPRRSAGYLGSCHALEIPFVFGTVHNPAVQGFSGGGDDAFALSAAMREAWTAFARTGSPGAWPPWEPGIRPDHGARSLARPARASSTGSTGPGTRSSRPSPRPLTPRWRRDRPASAASRRAGRPVDPPSLPTGWAGYEATNERADRRPAPQTEV